MPSSTACRDFVVVPRLAPDGCRIIINGLTDPDPNNYVFEDHQKLLLMMIDAMVAAEPTLPGVYIIYDLDMGLISHFWKFGFWLQRKLFAYFQVSAAYSVGGIAVSVSELSFGGRVDCPSC